DPLRPRPAHAGRRARAHPRDPHLPQRRPGAPRTAAAGTRGLGAAPGGHERRHPAVPGPERGRRGARVQRAGRRRPGGGPGCRRGRWRGAHRRRLSASGGPGLRPRPNQGGATLMDWLNALNAYGADLIGPTPWLVVWTIVKILIIAIPIIL